MNYINFYLHAEYSIKKFSHRYTQKIPIVYIRKFAINSLILQDLSKKI